MANKVSIKLDGDRLEGQAGITVKKAMELSGYKVSKYPEPPSLFAPCETGGCWSCAVEVNGQPQLRGNGGDSQSPQWERAGV